MEPAVGSVESLWRFPVKSMLGEQLDEAQVTSSGIVGDRGYALIDPSDGKVVTAKNPRKWGRLLTFRATYVEDPQVSAALPPARIAMPDGAEVRTDDADVDKVLSAAVGRDVELRHRPPAVKTIEEVFPDIEGLAPTEVIEATRVDTDPEGTVSDLPLGLDAPAESFFDLAVLHLLTTSTLEHLGALYPEGTFDVRRYRPNVLVHSNGDGFVENDWAMRSLTVGDGVRISVTIPTMRCVMTTLEQDGLTRDPKLLQTIARHNRIEIAGLGQWACAGVYAGVAQEGTIRVGDPVTLADA